MNRFWHLILVLAAVFYAGCTQTEDPCADIANSGSSACKTGSGVNVDASQLAIEFAEASFYDQNEDKWKSVRVSGNKVEDTIPLYANAASSAPAEALKSVIDAEALKASGGKNIVPYIKIMAKPEVRYAFQYRKIDSEGNELHKQIGEAIKSGDYAYIPFINEMFNQKLLTPGAGIGTTYKNIFTITGSLGGKNGMAKQVEVLTTVTVPNIDYQVTFASDVLGYNLKNRWLKYKKDQTGTQPNDDFKFVTLVDRASGSGEVSDYDVQIIFKDDLKIELEQELFVEMPINFDLFKLTQTIVPARGHSFYTTKITLDSYNDFKHKVYLDNVLLDQNGKVFSRALFPGGKNFNITLSLDFTPNTRYVAQDPNIKGLHYPLKPHCLLEENKAWAPWQKEPLIDQNASSGKLLAICHPDLGHEVLIDPSNNPLNRSLEDTWFRVFSYDKYDAAKNYLGSFYGIRSVKFKVSGCFKVQIKDPNTSTWSNRTNGGSNCGDSSATNEWAPFTAEKTFTVFDHAAEYENVTGLKTLIDALKAATTIQDNNMEINNERLSGNTIRHIY
nr:hypothetical protein BdHM001_35320 [Bdellovibrio sp. HM001]